MFHFIWQLCIFCRIREAENAPRPQRTVKKVSNPYDNNVSDEADNAEDNKLMGEATYQPAGEIINSYQYYDWIRYLCD